MTVTASDQARFRRAYGAHRAAEGRGGGGIDELLSLPYLRAGPHARAWQVRACTFDDFVRRVLLPRARSVGRPLRVADLGAGNGWLCFRLARLGHQCHAIDVRTDDVDGLGAAAAYAKFMVTPFSRVAASFDSVPLADACCDIAVFNASLHYALDLAATLAEARRLCAAGGSLAILDSPFYARNEDGAAMVAEKRARAGSSFGGRAGELMSLPFIEYLTPGRLADASAPLGLKWRRRRVRYPLWYEMRPLKARLQRARRPSRFDLWEAVVP